MDAVIESLLWEREGYLRRGLKSRAAEVDKELAARGYKDKSIVETASVEPPAERAVRPRAATRKQD